MKYTTNPLMPFASFPSRWTRDGNLGFAAIVFAVLILTIVPIWFLVAGSFRVSTESGVSQTSLQTVLTTPRYWLALRNSLILGAMVATATVAVVGIVCWLVTRTDVPFKRLWSTIIPMSIAVGPVVGTMAWIGLLSPRGVGLLNHATRFLWGGDLLDIYSMLGIVLVLVYVQAPFAFLFMFGGFSSLASDHEEAARVHGAGLATIIGRISFPATKSGLLGGWVLLFTASLQNLSVYALVGSRSHIDTIPNAMYRITQSAVGQTGAANVLALLIIVPSLIVLGAHVAYTRRLGTQRVVGRQVGRPGIRLGWWRYPAVLALASYVTIMVALPLASLIFSSFLRYQTSDITLDMLTLDNYAALWTDDIRDAFLVTLELALISSTVGTIVSLLLAYVASRRYGVLSTLAGIIPVLMLAIPGFAIGLGFLWASFTNSMLRDVAGSVYGLAIAITVAYLGFGTRVFAASLNQFGSAYEEAGRMAGKFTWVRIAYIVAPMMLPSAISVWRLMVVLSFMEFNIVALLYTNRTIPLSVYMFLQLDTQPASSVYALGVFQLLPIALLFVLTLLPGRRLRQQERNAR